MSPVAAAPHQAYLRSHAGRWLHRLLAQLVKQSARDIRKIPRWEEQSIHSLRKRMKKLQAMLQLGRPAIPEATLEAVLKDVRDLKNLLAGPRDDLIMAKVAQDLGITLPTTRVKSTSTAGKLKRASALSEQLLTDVTLLDLSQLDWRMVAESFTKTYKSCLKAWRKAQSQPTSEKLHEWRKKVKRLYYQSTALEPWLHHPKRLRHTRKLGSLLGNCHDLDVFRSTHQSSKRHPSSEGKSQVESRRETLLSKIEHRAGKVFSRSPRKIKAESCRLLLSLSPAKK